MFFKTIQITLFSTLALAAPIAPNKTIFGRATTAADLIVGIVPGAASCAGASVASECTTASQAAPFLIQSMVNQGITTNPEIGALIALMGYETGDFKYNINHFPGRPGQGTRNMQMPNYNLMYAQSIPALKAPLAAITTATTTAGLSDDVLNKIRDLVTVDEYTWGSAGWFLKTQCASVRPALAAGTDAGWQAYMACVGVSGDDRTAYWTRAKKVMGF